eukprot:121074_1
MSSEPNEHVPNDEFINWSRFKRRILLNKRIWKYIGLYCLLYAGSKRLVFNEWYKPNYKPKVSVSTPLSNMDQDMQLIENVIGFDSHKPASNFIILICQIIHCYLLVYKTKCKYGLNTLKQRGDSIHPNYKNKDIEDKILDIHISVWTFLLFVDGLNCYRKGKINNSDKLMFMHHILGLITTSIYKYHNNAGEHWTWVAFWSETIGIFSMTASLIRVIYQKKRPDLVILRQVSDVLFGINVLFFTYARVFLFASVSQTMQHWNITVMDKYNQYSKLTRLYQLLCFGMNFVGLWWVAQSWRVIGTKIIEAINEKK